jgi:hypothetical protein
VRGRRQHGGPVRDFDIELLDDAGHWQCARQVRNNYQRLVKLPLEAVTRGVRFVVRAGWGGERAPVHVFGFDVSE